MATNTNQPGKQTTSHAMEDSCSFQPRGKPKSETLVNAEIDILAFHVNRMEEVTCDA